MKAKHLTLALLPGLALGVATVLVAPGSEVLGFSKLGSKLGTGQRDVRVYDNFSDAATNNNTTPDPMFPGWFGVEMATWKAAVEWGSLPHGDGSGDPTQANLGDGGANFDAIWMGNAAAIGNSNHNVVSAINNCGGGVIAYMEGPSGDGWRIRFCDNSFNFADGPGTVNFNQMDFQSVQTHEYGHALGLGHSGVGGSTMWPSIGSGSESGRSISPDDIAGVQSIYGVKEPDKPVICETRVSGSTLTIEGAYFTPTGNEVWFCPTAVTLAKKDPRIKVTNLASTNNGTELTLTIPPGASAGDVIVKTSDSGFAALSNAFPTDLAGTIGVSCPFSVTGMSPTTIPALEPGTAETVTLTGFDLGNTVQIDFNGTSVPSSRWTIVNNETITIDMLQGGTLGSGNSLTLSDGSASYSIPVTIVAPATPVLEVGDGNPAPGNTVADGETLNIVVAGTPGTVHRVYVSPSSQPSLHPVVEFDIGNQFAQLSQGAVFTIGPDGYTVFSGAVSYRGASPTTFYSQSMDITTPPSPLFGVSNVQSILLTP